MNIRFCKSESAALITKPIGASDVGLAGHGSMVSSHGASALGTRKRILGDVLGLGVFALGAATAALMTSGAQADDAAPHSVRVRLSDVDLNTAKGAHEAYLRLEEAVESVCGESAMHIEVMVRGPGECVRDAFARAVRDMQSTELSKLYVERHGIRMAKQYGITPSIMTAGN